MLRLCSSSQTRSMLLTNAGVAFKQESVDFDEEAIIASSPKNFVYQATVGKYNANVAAFVTARVPAREVAPPTFKLELTDNLGI